MRTPWLLHQLSDSAFPTGGFAHSGGLEAAAQLGEVHDPATLEGFLTEWLWQAGHGALPLVSAAFEPGGTEGLAALDARCEAFLVGHVARRASRTQGRAFLDTCARIFPEAEPIRIAVRSRSLHCHHAPVFGAVLRALGVERRQAQELFLSLGARGVLAAAVRLGVVGTHEAQRMLRGESETLSLVLARCGGLGAADLAQTAPLLDLFGGHHDRLYSRLFQS